MSNHICDELQAKRRLQHEFRAENEKWVQQYEPFFTHALTLTFNHTKVRRRMMEMDPTMCLSSPEMVEIYKDDLRAFKWQLVKSLYGNAWKRYSIPFVFIPVLEGLGKDQKPHYHCMVGLARDRNDVFADRVCSIWNKMAFGGERIDIQPYISSGWTRYSTKNALFANRENIDWENVLVPQPKSLAE